MKKFRLAAAMLCLSAAAQLCACSGSAGEAPETAQTSAAVAATEAETTTEYISTLTLTGFDGMTVTFIGVSSETYPQFPLESENGDLINDALYQRDRKAEEEMGVSLEYVIPDSAEKVTSLVSTAVTAGDASYDVIMSGMYSTSAPLMLKSVLLDYSKVPVVDLDREWWSKFNKTDLYIGGRIYFPTGEITAGHFRSQFAMLYNKRLAENFGVTDLYGTVLDGDWTLDTLSRYMKDVALDLDGNGVMNELDQYALCLDDVAGVAYFIAAGGKMTRFDEDGMPYLTLGEESTITLVNELAAIVGDKEIVLRGEDYVKNMEHTVWKEGRSLFIGNTMNNVYNFRDMDDDFGIIPLPKRDEAQEEYLSYAQPWSGMGVSIPLTCVGAQLEAAGTTVEVLAALSGDTLVPAMYEKTLKGKVARDEVSAQTLDIIFSGASYDLNYIFNWGNSANILRDSVLGNLSNYVSSYEKIANAAQSALDKTIETIENLG